MNHSTPGLPVHHHLPEFTQIHIHLIGDAIQPSHPLLSPSPPAPNPSQHQSFFQWVNSSHEVAKVLEFQLQHHSLQRTPRADLLQNGLVGSPCSPRDSQEFSPTPQFKSINSLALSFLHSPTLTSYKTTGKTIALTRRILVGKVPSLLLSMLSRLVINFLPKSEHLLIWWLQSPSAVVLGSKKIKSVIVSIVSLSICHEVMGPDGDCSHEIKRRLLLGRKVMTNLDSIFKSRDITFPTKVCLVKAMVFPVVMYGYVSRTVKKADCWRIDVF